jgi:hypothetical protein
VLSLGDPKKGLRDIGEAQHLLEEGGSCSNRAGSRIGWGAWSFSLKTNYSLSQALPVPALALGRNSWPE